MSEPLIRHRTLPDSLRYLAQKLDEPLSDAERAGVALTLNSLADGAEAGQDAFAHELAEKIRAERGSGTYEPGVYFHGGMDYAADLIDPQKSAGPARPDEEPTP